MENLLSLSLETRLCYNLATMSKRQIIMVLGVWVGIFLFLGIPGTWKEILAVATGLILVVVAYSLKSEGAVSMNKDVPYAEHKSEVTASIEKSPTSPITNQNDNGSMTNGGSQ